VTDFGADINTPDASDLDPYFGVVTSWRCLGQALGRRLITPRGTLIDDSAYGLDVRSWINGALTPTQVADLEALIADELVADERVETVSVEVSLASQRLTIRAIVDTADGPFRLVLAIGAVTAEILAAEPV